MAISKEIFCRYQIWSEIVIKIHEMNIIYQLKKLNFIQEHFAFLCYTSASGSLQIKIIQNSIKIN